MKVRSFLALACVAGAACSPASGDASAGEATSSAAQELVWSRVSNVDASLGGEHGQAMRGVNVGRSGPTGTTPVGLTEGIE